ncbi:Uncharacterised protein [Haemophilus pittmaniae]|uniref:HmsD n=2 Tax=Haemophilus pittmaniae TaxID=249188 RepID=A0A377IY44_9PAST|nr:hypothetical protein [Haemophilus pittmaniae]MBS6027286.1 HmsD [Haemophilus pittmaniae]SNV72604.1 Uncharacterised protein [Haemophilus pittmaniae]STO93171.1 Uncharacterised protein [Haemophilus pittmaniae]
MSSVELQRLMVINKGKHLPMKMKFKSVLLDILTWVLWIYIITFVIRYAQGIFTQPVLETFFFVDVIGLMFGAAILLVLLAYFWSIITVEKTEKSKA